MNNYVINTLLVLTDSFSCLVDLFSQLFSISIPEGDKNNITDYLPLLLNVKESIGALFMAFHVGKFLGHLLYGFSKISNVIFRHKC